ncbi:transcription termination/antitermination protein NusA [Bathymodiolus platifrons methanotrophic gill symbiont]|uniref:transcription termination factor NusA n=1 Tax=Bathymodiolus platifrons methanotrophic gill symbiont TaxID=113268 RepID=UPI0011C88A5D|nr:transcription termination factor NusA [Bathymodiolus platifrons methanotrophic gill symbiont]TXK94581.1 transcription termination/antitermination protein NusA [Methylococcaceae bacterium CS4]TXK95579.1 transcription termination/antitermination protein NusA [Methylococcaceae bacterium HT1]TXK99099.1 transcription termination/antitermination protein NusA [Methylococcaceae bacterium CS5]TXL04067.1 transcription termination/antitermination protein NusA [Methylococcaceae bacterium CS1]TXL06667.1
MADKDVLLVVDVFSNEKDIEKEVIFQAIESALESATVSRYEFPIKARVSIDRITGENTTYRRWQVVEETDEFPGGIEFPTTQISLQAAQVDDPEIEVDDFVEDEIEAAEFGRISAQAAKQVIIHKVREAERKKVADAYIDKVGELVTGVIKRIEKGSVYMDLGGNADAFIPREHMIPRETVRVGDRIRGYLKEVRTEVRGPQLYVSRTAPELLLALFRLEVPEVGEGLINVLGAARDPGSRAKVAVRSNDLRIDPVGACVGMRGSRVQTISNELNGERIDVILWNENEAQFVINSMAPAEIESIVVDEDKHTMDVAVSSDSLSQAIGRGGQNVRLATELTGWELNVRDVVEVNKDSEEVLHKLVEEFKQQLNVDQDIATVLAEVGFNSVEEIAYVPSSEMLEIDGFDAELVETLRSRAKDFLLINAIASEEKIETAEPAEDLLTMEGMVEELAFELASKGIITMDDLAEQAVDDLLDLTGMDEEMAAKLIMKAREPWFANDNGEG